MKITIITVCLNEESTIERTLTSVLSQTYRNIEYIVIDGGSTDGTSTILDKYRPQIDMLVSEKDEGIYDAMNYGLERCTGDIVYFLNADDYLYQDSTVAYVAEWFRSNPGADILSGKVAFLNTPVINGVKLERTNFRFYDKLELYLRPNPQQCIFSRREAFDTVGVFNLSYPMCADYEWLVRAIDAGVRIEFVEEYFAYFDYMGISFTQDRKRLGEKRKIILRNSSPLEISRFLVNGMKQMIRGKQRL